MTTKFFTNSHERNLFEKFKGLFDKMKDLHSFHAVVGYFRSSGYFALQPYLKNVKDIKILVGINVDQMFAESQRRGLIYFGDENKTKEEFLKWFIQDIKDARYSAEVEDGILQFINDLIDGKIEVRAHNSAAIHAKFYLFLPEEHSEHSDGWVIMGSSNLTEAGLGIKKSPNYELNIALKDFDDVEFTKNEFKRLWEQSTSILPADIQQFKQKTHIGQEFTPYELYLKFLIEYFGKNIDYDPDTVGDLPKTFKKLSYQIDAVNQGYQMLLEHNGFFLADVVGLGKTVVAAMIAKRFLIANGSLNTKILVVYPPALEKNWKNTFKTFGIDKHCKFITNGRLDKIANNDDVDYWAKEEYDLVLVDEAHRYRNHNSTMFNNLQRICKSERVGEGLVSGKRKKVMLISATPLNNRPQDLYYQLLLFQDARRSTLPETNLQEFFGPIIRDYKDIMRNDNDNIERIRELYSLIRERVISPVTVRRTRKDLKNYPDYLKDLEEQGIKFPEITDPREKVYLLNSKLNKLFYKTIFNLTDEDKLSYSRYQAISYLKEGVNKDKYEKADLVSRSLASIMKTQMVKRLESSFFAFKITVNNLKQSTARMIEMFDNDKIFIAPDLGINELIDKGLSFEEIEKKVLYDGISNIKSNVFTADDFVEEYYYKLKKDLEILEEIHNSWSEIEEDPKLDKFVETINSELFDKELNPTGKLVVFTESKDTAEYLHGKLEVILNQKILCISADNRNKQFDIIQENFDANYEPLKQRNNYNIIISTDVLAEGVNMHRSNIIVNYDTPWNATRLMQRIGRVNRIGSVADCIYNYCFYPSQQGDEELKLYNNALIKLQGFHSAFGEDAKIYTHREIIEDVKLHKEGMDEGEDKRLLYLKLIRDFKDNNPKEFKKIRNFPMKARVGREWNVNGKQELKGSSIVFLKSPYKMEFYKVSNKNKTESITFLQAASYFEAKVTEKGLTVPEFHYKQIENALFTFEKDFFGSLTETVTTSDITDGVTKQALKFLRVTRKDTTNSDVKNACKKLIGIVEKGIYTSLPNELKKVKQKLDKSSITFAQVDNLILLMAKKYDAFVNKEDEDTLDLHTEIDYNIQPDIVLSETFID
ncbi:MAG: helicase-related protein [Flavobacterium sp.]|uniref:helicase-related protein n=3 Tax=Flavobacterium sp. TaxID=239 RepID=UPI0022C2C479|nr:helicase-related protein [Flavobacterium sp.]MCZ8168619.1 helicase-related protein [Flavobacterium sp.]MCZ8297265.1 helicase-related protein [Flavobacterium sp.]